MATLLSLANAANQTSPEKYLNFSGEDIQLFISGEFDGGVCYLEVKNFQGIFVRYPELSFSQPTAQRVTINGGNTVRLVVEGATSVTAEVNA